MPSKRQYDLVLDDGPDSKIPLHNEDAFQHGIQFLAKYIGTLDVPRPTSRVEIVAAMRRIRHEFKAKAVKKKKVSVTVSVEGVKVVLLKKNRRKQQQWTWDESHLVVLQHPIYRIFYVSHDSQDLKIFSYIARDSSTNVFRCNVFKSYKKSQAMNIVRTIGQAFEVCHRISLQATAQNEEGNDAGSEKSSEDGNEPAASQSTSTLEKPPVASSPSDNGTSTSTQSPEDAVKQTQQLLDSLCIQPFKHPGTLSSPVILQSDGGVKDDGSAGTFHRLQLLRQELELQTQQTQFTIAQMQLLKDQLAAETAARLEAQARTHQLLVQNRELLAHVGSLVSRLVQLEASKDDLGNTDLQQSSSEILATLDGSIFNSGLLVSASSDLPRLNDISFIQNTSSTQKLNSPLGGSNREVCLANLLQSTSDTVDGSLLTSDRMKINGSIDRQGFTVLASTTNAEKYVTATCTPLNSIAFNNLHSENKNLKENEGQRSDLMKVITPIPPQDATGNRLELNIAPKLDPPPRISRNSARTCATVTLTTSNRSSAICSTTTFHPQDVSHKSDGAVEKRCSWENYTSSTKPNGVAGMDLDSLPKFQRDGLPKSPDRLLDPISLENGIEKSHNGIESSQSSMLAIHSFRGIKNRFAIQHQNSIDSTAKLKLSFSDNE